jgi:hypothetical protein
LPSICIGSESARANANGHRLRFQARKEPSARQGLAGSQALGLVVMLRAAMVGIVAISAKPFGVYLVQLLRGLLGT